MLARDLPFILFFSIFCGLFHTSLASICSQNDSVTLPTWCENHNPYITVLNISDVKYANKDCWADGCAVTEDEGVRYFCESEDNFAKCISVTSIGSFESRIQWLQYIDENNTVQYLSVPDDYPPFSFIILGLFSGQIVGNVIQTVYAPDRKQLNGLVSQVHNDSVTLVSGLSNCLNSPVLGYSALFTTSSQSASVLWMINTTVWPPTQDQVAMIWGNTRGPNERLIETILWQSVYDPNVVYWALLVNRTISASSFQTSIQFFTLNASLAYDTSLMLRNIREFTWTLDTPPTLEVGNFSIFTHRTNLSTAFVGGDSINRTLISLSTPNHVHILEFETSQRGALIQDQVISGIGDHNSPSCFLYSTLYTITASSIMGEVFTRTTNISFDSRFPSELIWVSLGVSANSSNMLIVISLNEFLVTNFTENNSSITRLDDPAWRASLPWNQCSPAEFYTPEGCKPRFVYQSMFSSRIKSIKTRARPIPENANQTGLASMVPQSTLDTCSPTLDNCSEPTSCEPFLACMREQQPKPDNSSNCYYSQFLDFPQFAETLRAFLYNVLFIHTAGANGLQDKIFLFGFQQVLCPSPNSTEGLIDGLPGGELAYLNEVDMIGTIEYFAPSGNSVHLFVAVGRNRFDLEQLGRFSQICATLDQDPDNVFLQAFVDLCTKYGTRPPPNINDFAWYVSSCMPGTYCPTMDRFFLHPVGKTASDQIPDGLYTLRSMEVTACEPGFFCQNGARLQCPVGHYCPTSLMGTPKRCTASPSFNTTCFHDNPANSPGLTNPVDCALGAICLVPYLPGISAPPGFAINPLNKTDMLECGLGSWCILGRSSLELGDNDTYVKADLRCPDACFCSNSSVITPTICEFSADVGGANYCPAGSYKQELCPSGHFCSLPNTTEKCPPHRYCPPGSFAEETCPPGYYCPSSNESILCPAKFYCMAGSVEPRPCSPVTHCPPGTPSVKNSAVIPLALFFAVIFPAVGWRYYLYIRNRKRREREEQKLREEARTVELASQDKKGEEINLKALSSDESEDEIKIKSPDVFIDLSFENLGLKLADGRSVLDGVTGRILHGRVTAVMGPSGAGKSTFVTTLCGKASYGTQTGKILINGTESNLSEYRKLVGFVPQEDIMHRTLTVKEILINSAMTRLPRNLTMTEKHKKVNEVITTLGLTQIRHNVIGDETNRGISGGQRKRVNIGMELVADPVVLFLDEPTSGLDSASSKEVCQALRNIAELGLTIITVIHQPRYEIFQLFHDVLLLGKGGRTVYLGSSTEALAYFEKLGFHCPPHANPADFFMDVISGQVPRENFPYFQPSDLFDLWEQREIKSPVGLMDESIQAPTPPALIPKRSTANFFEQMFVFTSRAFVQLSRNWNAFLFEMALNLAAGMFTGLCYYQQFYEGPSPASVVALCPPELLAKDPSPCRLPVNDPLPGQGVVATLSLSLAAVSSSISVFGNERTVFWRESSAGISSLAYFCAKIFAHTLNITAGSLCYLALYYQLITPFSTFGEMFGICFLIYWTASSFGYLVSIVASPHMSQLFGVLSILVCMMFSGMNPRFEQLHTILGGILYYPTFLSFIRWSQEAYYTNEIKYYTSVYDDVQTGMDIFEYKLYHYPLAMAMIFVIGVVIRILSYVALECLHRDKRK